ncbi:hypothetical protein JCM11251_001649 [Rhodosporidiobolus azoricus]
MTAAAGDRQANESDQIVDYTWQLRTGAFDVPEITANAIVELLLSADGLLEQAAEARPAKPSLSTYRTFGVPTDIACEVIEHLAAELPSADAITALARCSRTCRAFRAIAEPLLYRHVKLPMRSQDSSRDDGKSCISFLDVSSMLLRRLAARPELLCQLEAIEIGIFAPAESAEEIPVPPDNPLRALSLILTVPNDGFLTPGFVQAVGQQVELILQTAYVPFSEDLYSSFVVHLLPDPLHSDNTSFAALHVSHLKERAKARVANAPSYARIERVDLSALAVPEVETKVQVSEYIMA